MVSFIEDDEKEGFLPTFHTLLHLAALGLLGYIIITKPWKPKGSVILPPEEVRETVRTYSEPTPVLKGFDIDPYKGMTIPSGAYGIYKVEEMLMRKIKKQPF